jgi:phosphoribosylamine--glycine ligase
MMATTNGTLAETEVVFEDKHACCVIMASNGYPQSYEKGFEINIPEEIANNVYVAGAAEKDGKLVTSGGRVLAVTVNGEGIEKQRETIYAEIAKIEYEGKYCRRDIGLDLLNYKG